VNRPSTRKTRTPSSYRNFLHAQTQQMQSFESVPPALYTPARFEQTRPQPDEGPERFQGSQQLLRAEDSHDEDEA
jgi:hypothetical protein